MEPLTGRCPLTGRSVRGGGDSEEAAQGRTSSSQIPIPISNQSITSEARPFFAISKTTIQLAIESFKEQLILLKSEPVETHTDT